MHNNAMQCERNKMQTGDKKPNKRIKEEKFRVHLKRICDWLSCFCSIEIIYAILPLQFGLNQHSVLNADFFEERHCRPSWYLLLTECIFWQEENLHQSLFKTCTPSAEDIDWADSAFLQRNLHSVRCVEGAKLKRQNSINYFERAETTESVTLNGLGIFLITWHRTTLHCNTLTTRSIK